jgi:hypothetical protein
MASNFHRRSNTHLHHQVFLSERHILPVDLLGRRGRLRVRVCVRSILQSVGRL